MKTCTAIIVNYNTGKLLKKVVDAALSCFDITEIFVIDNNSSDQSMSLLESHKKLKTFFRKDNHGFAASCNYGAHLSSADYFLFLNPDCIIQNDTLDTLIKNLEHNPEAAIIGCRVNNPDGTEQRATRRRLPTFWRTFKTVTKIENLAFLCSCFAGVNLSYKPMPKTIQNIEAISGAFILMKSIIFDEISGFDESFPLHFEDLDLFKRTLNANYQILFNPNINVSHYQGTSSQSNPKVNQLKKQGLRNYFKKHNSSLSYWLIKIIT